MTIDVLIAHEGAREAVLAALQLPAPLGKLLIQYLAMFRPAKRKVSWERVSTLLEELSAPIAAARIERNGTNWAAPLEYWKAALEQMVHLRDTKKLQLPLRSHGYLLEVIAGMAGKAAEKAEASGSAPIWHWTDTPLAEGNRGFGEGDRVEVTRGARQGWTGVIYSLGATFAALEDVHTSTGTFTGTVSVPYTELKKLEGDS